MSDILQIINIILTVVALGILCVGVYQKNTNALCESKKRLDDKTVIVTGGTAGMGLEIAKDLARRGARVIIACPFEDEGLEARKHIIQSTGNNNVVFKILDLSSLECTRKFAADILQTEDRLDILMNNAGVGAPDDYLTSDGISFIMQVNYFGTFLLTLLLLPLLKKTGTPSEPSRIVNTSSILHNIGNVDIENLNNTNHYYSVRVYGSSKLCLVLFSCELTKRLSGSSVVVNCVDPGAVGTRIFHSVNKFVGMAISFMFSCLFKTPWQGAQTALHVALDKEAGGVSGKFFKNCRLSKAVSRAYDDKIAIKLWEKSLRLIELSEFEVDHCFKYEKLVVTNKRQSEYPIGLIPTIKPKGY